MSEENTSGETSPKQSLLTGLIGVIRGPSFFFAIVVSLLLINVRKGPDYNTYLHWSRAAVRGDINEIQTYVESPVGLPVSQWSAGPGLAAAPLVGLCGALQMKVLPQIAESSFYILVPAILDEHGVFLTAAIFAVVFWCAMGKLMVILTDGRTNWVIFGLAAGFVGTHLGYYSAAVGAELLSLAPLALLAVELAKPMKSRLGSVFLVGSCTAILIMIRPYLALYAAPTMVVTALRVWQQTNAPQRFMLLPLLAGLAGLGIAQVGIVNYWMTGDWTQSAYVFGNGDFKSFDFGSPEISAVLFHPLHGLVAYHPMYVLGVVAMMWLVFRAPTASERCLWGSFLLIIAAHVWIQAAWYQWWLATTVTFGMRGMAAAGIPCVTALIRMVMQLQTSKRGGLAIPFVTASVIVTGCWSWLLMMLDATDFFTYAELFRSQQFAMRDIFVSMRILTLVFAAVLSTISLGNVLAKSEEQNWSRFQQIATIFLATMAVDFLLWGWIDNAIMSVQYGVVLIACVLAWVLYRKRDRVAWRNEPLRASVAIGCMVFLAVMLGWFANVAIPTHQQLSTGNTPKKPYEWQESFFVTEVKNGYIDYMQIPGFEDRKERLKRFLEPFGLPEVDSTANE